MFGIISSFTNFVGLTFEKVTSLITVVAESNPITMLMAGIALGFIMAIIVGNLMPSVTETKRRIKNRNDSENPATRDLGTFW